MLINGERKKTIDVTDRGFQYGDGLFETIEVCNGQAVFLDRHLDRLQAGCDRLHIPFPNREVLCFEAATLIQQSSFQQSASEYLNQAVLKIIVTRGSGGRGYCPPDLIQPTRVLSLHPFPDYPSAYQEQGIIARFCDTRLGLNRTLAGIKHLNRLEQIMARSEWCDPAIEEGIMLDSNDHVIEGTRTNLFYVKNNSLYTASLAKSGIEGIMRSIIISLASEHEWRVIEHTFSKDDLMSADEIFVSNSIIGIWPVRQIAGNYFPVGIKTRQIQAWLAQFKHRTLSASGHSSVPLIAGVPIGD